MSAILLSNPFASPPTAVPAVDADPKAALAVTPSEQGPGAENSGNSTGFGSHDRAQDIIMWAKRDTTMARPDEATWDSVVNAQTSEEGQKPFGNDLPEVKMPDPLPTSPFLKPA